MLHWIDDDRPEPWRPAQPPALTTVGQRVAFLIDCAIIAVVGLGWLWLLFSPEPKGWW